MLYAVELKTNKLGGIAMITIDEFKRHIGPFVAIKLAQGSPHTAKAYRTDLLRYCVFLRSRDVLDATVVSSRIANQYAQLLRDEGKKNATISRMLAALSSYCDYLRCEAAESLVNPFHKMPIRRTLPGNVEPKPIDSTLLELLLGGIDDLRDRAMFRMFAASGLRVSEMRSLNRDSISIIEEIDGSKRTIVGVGEVVGKGNKKRKFYVDQVALIAYAEYVMSRKDAAAALFISERGTRISIRGIQFRLDYWCKRFGAPHFNVHRLRHSFATELANNDIDPTVLRDLLGHFSFITTMRYFKLSDKTVRRRYFAAMQRAKLKRPSN
jgi:site-specific recombinase XerC